MKKIFNVFFLQLIVLIVHGQDSLLSMKLNPFLIGYLNQKENLYPITFNPQILIQIPENEPLIYRTNGQELIRTSKNTYIFITGTGRLYQAVSKNDTAYFFKQIDKTISVNYNIGSYEFTIGEDIYSYGGYGFWKTNGILKRYNFKDREWDVVPMEREVIAQFYPSRFIWFDYKTNLLYVPVQREQNDAIRLPNKELTDIIPECNVLDVQNQVWNKMGTVSDGFIDLTQKLLVPTYNYQFSGGQLFFIHGRLYSINYPNNQVLQSNDAIEIQTLTRLNKPYLVSYIKEDTFFAFHSINQKLDTLLLKGIAYKKFSPILRDDKTVLYYAGGVSFLMLTAFLSFIKLRKRKPKRDEIISSENEFSRFSKKLFNETEISLIQLCIKNMKEGRYVDINEINHVLGVKNKNKGLQKKVRSEVINSINEKFKNIHSSEKPLIESIRNQDDKRYFDYFIREEHFHILDSY